MLQTCLRNDLREPNIKTSRRTPEEPLHHQLKLHPSPLFSSHLKYWPTIGCNQHEDIACNLAEPSSKHQSCSANLILSNDKQPYMVLGDARLVLVDVYGRLAFNI